MWAAKGYRSYRGRPPKGKIALAVVLVLVIVAAVAVIVLQEYLVYDADGNARLELPWQQDTEQTEELPQEPGEVDIVIQEPGDSGRGQGPVADGYAPDGGLCPGGSGGERI